MIASTTASRAPWTAASSTAKARSPNSTATRCSSSTTATTARVRSARREAALRTRAASSAIIRACSSSPLTRPSEWRRRGGLSAPGLIPRCTVRRSACPRATRSEARGRTTSRAVGRRRMTRATTRSSTRPTPRDASRGSSVCSALNTRPTSPRARTATRTKAPPLVGRYSRPSASTTRRCSRASTAKSRRARDGCSPSPPPTRAAKASRAPAGVTTAS